MIKIEATATSFNKDCVNVRCKIKSIRGERGIVTAELATMLETIDKNFPGMLGDALDLLIEKAKRQL